jgi:hypothetical protein
MTTLWKPLDRSPYNSDPESQRVLELYVEARIRNYGPDHVAGHKCAHCGRWRGWFAQEWVHVARQAGLHEPGQDARTPLREGQTELDRRVDAARTRLRQFEAGQPQNAWVLCGIETTLADMVGMAYPPCAYEVQGTLIAFPELSS